MGLWRRLGGFWGALGVVKGVETPKVRLTTALYRLYEILG